MKQENNSHIEIFKQVTLGVRNVVGAALLGSVICACNTGAAALKKEIQSLEQELTRIKTERTNLESRSNALDDKLVVYQKKLKKCESGAEKPLLEVVRIEPEQPDKTYEAAVQFSKIQSDNETIVEHEERPKFFLTGMRSSGGVGVRDDSLNPLTAAGADVLGADNLGVVDQPTDLPMEVFQAAYRAYSNRNYEEALNGFSQLVKDYPKHDYADDAIFWRAECYFALGKFFLAIGEFERLITRYPNSEKAALSLYKIGFTYDRLADRQKALEHYFKVVDNYPGTDAARRASSRVLAIEGNNKPGGSVMPTASKR